MPETSQKKPLQRILIIGSGLAFLGFMIGPLTQMFRSTPPASQPVANQPAASDYKQLQVQEEGYQKVLQREPENPVALQGLAQTRWQMYQATKTVESLEKTLDPLEKLIKVYPKEKKLIDLRDKIKEVVAQEKQRTKPSTSPNK
jgi:hypothetical protein